MAEPEAGASGDVPENMEMQAGRLNVKAFAAFVAVFAIVVAGMGGWTVYLGYQLLTAWPTADGEVIRSEVVRVPAGGSANNLGAARYQAQVEFRYTVQGREYISRAGSTTTSANPAQMEEKLNSYGLGSHHPIRFDPSHPERIRFDISPYPTRLFIGGFAVLSLALGIGIFLLSVAARRISIERPK